MTREAEFLFYQDQFITYSARLNEVHRCIGNMGWRKVKVSDDLLNRAADNIMVDSSWERESLEDELRDWVEENNYTCPLFDYRTLAILTGEGNPSYIERNTHSYIDKITTLSDGYGDIQNEPWKSNHDVVSFKGMYNFQIDFIVNGMKKMAEDALERLRDIGTTLCYMRNQHCALNSAYNAGPTPDTLQSGKSYDDGPPMFSFFWMQTVCASSETHGSGIIEDMMIMSRMTHPDPTHPPLLTHFSSATSNRVELEFIMKDVTK